METSGRVGSVAIAHGSTLLKSVSFRTDQNHAVELLPTIATLCREFDCEVTDLDFLCVSIGPGSFTGLRIGVTVARTLAWATQLKLIGVPTLDVIAQNAFALSCPPPKVVVILDAKRQQVYAADYQLRQNSYHRTTEAAVVDPVEFLEDMPQPLYLMGEGIPFHREQLRRLPHVELDETYWRPKAEVVHLLGNSLIHKGSFTRPEDFVPHYLRLPEAEEKWIARRQGELDS